MADTGTSVITLKSLGWSLGLLTTSILAAGALAGGLLLYEQRITSDHRRALAEQTETRIRLARAHDDEKEIRSKIARYQEILAQGRTAPERRLDWVETLQKIKTERRLLGLEYEIAPQRRLDDKVTAIGGYDFLLSPMKIDLPLLHEGDLLGLLADLAAQVEALVSVRHCRLERLPAAAQGNANLKAQCQIDWITLQESVAGQNTVPQTGRN